MTAEERTKARLRQNIGNEIVDCGKYGRWHWQGTQYASFGWCGTCGINAFIKFTANFRSIKVEVEPDQKFCINKSVEFFEGDDAMTAAVEWTVNKLYELYKTVTDRIAPFQKGYDDYMKAVQGLR